jgi:2-oxoglutarate ferredoxin oxidoreductase subunit alpha
MLDLSVRVAGANGDGVESAGALLARLFSGEGLYVFSNRGYQSVIRGGHVWNQIRISDSKLDTCGETVDVLIALNQDAITQHHSILANDGVVIYDNAKVKTDLLEGRGIRLAGIPLIDIAAKAGGDPILRNVAAEGALLRILGMDIEVLISSLVKVFGRKKEEIVNSNIAAARAGYAQVGLQNLYSVAGDKKPRPVLDGNTALSIGAYAAGCKFYAAYPMTPASTIMQWFISHEGNGVMCKQTEDEIAAINMAIGAASTCVRAMCGTSGGGFSLMVEALGLAGMLEVPLVVVESQRSGPSTGLPTKTEQADVLFVMHASQGEFPRIVVAPRDVEESFYIGAEAHNLADRYQCPVIILMDLFLSEHSESVDGIDPDRIKIDRGKLVLEPGIEGQRFKRYELTEDGISPRTVPGTPLRSFVAPSDEHNEYGDLISDILSGLPEHIEMRVKMHSKRMRKMETMLKNETVFVPNVEIGDGEFFIVTFGSTTEACREAVKKMRASGLKVGLISFSYLMPLDPEKTRGILAGKKLIGVECNYTAQLAQVIKLATGIDIEKRILKYDGEAITGGEIASRAEEIIKGW